MWIFLRALVLFSMTLLYVVMLCNICYIRQHILEGAQHEHCFYRTTPEHGPNISSDPLRGFGNSWSDGDVRIEGKEDPLKVFLLIGLAQQL
jgi:hypothetical protein